MAPVARVLYTALYRDHKRGIRGYCLAKITFQRSCLYRCIGIGGSSVFLSAPSYTIQSYPLLQHALSKALLKPTRLARFPPPLVYLALAVRRTRVLNITCEITRYFIVIYAVLVQVAPASIPRKITHQRDTTNRRVSTYSMILTITCQQLFVLSYLVSGLRRTTDEKFDPIDEQ